jgi:hypothetical protein
VREFTDKGATPLGLAQPVAYHRLRAQELMLPVGTPWHQSEEEVEVTPSR